MMANSIEDASAEAVNPRQRHYVAGNEGLKHFEKLAPVAPQPSDLLAVNLGAYRAA